MSPKGKTLTQEKVKQLSSYDNICILCGHYEGVDQRVLDEYIDEEISIGDYVLTGGEIPALCIIDSVSRNIKGVLGKEDSSEFDSFSEGIEGLLEHPQYTRPREYRGMKVPEVLLNGNHAEIEKWRLSERQKRTFKRRKDLLL